MVFEFCRLTFALGTVRLVYLADNIVDALTGAKPAQRVDIVEEDEAEQAYFFFNF